MKQPVTVISGGTISFAHANPPKGAHKTYAPWLDRKLEKAVPIQLGDQTLHQFFGALFWETGKNYLFERHSDNALVWVFGDHVFTDAEYQAKRAARLAEEAGRQA